MSEREEKSVLTYLTAPITEEIRELSQSVKLLALNATRFQGEVLDRRPNDSVGNFNIDLNLGTSRSLEVPTVFDCSIGMTLECMAKSEPGRSVGRMSCVVGIRYQARSAEEMERVTDEDLLAFAGRISMVHAWPYLREYFQSNASRLGLPRVVLPTLSKDLLAGLTQITSDGAPEAGERDGDDTRRDP